MKYSIELYCRTKILKLIKGVARGGSKGSDEPPFQTKKFLNIASQA